MRVTSVSLTNFRSFVSTEPIPLGKITVLIGENNVGKSSILKGIAQMQEGLGNWANDTRLGSNESLVILGLKNVIRTSRWAVNDGNAELHIRNGSNLIISYPDGSQYAVEKLLGVDPQHFIVPFYSKRKVFAFGETVNRQVAHQIDPTLTNLSAKLARIGNWSFPGHASYSEACKEILGFEVTAIPSDNGQRPGVFLPDRVTLTVDQMGDGVPNIAGLLADLALSEQKLFLIEEPENDLHPHALKALLDLVVRSSELNQFVISTHSNIVVRHLCTSDENFLYKISARPGVFPVEAEISRIENQPEARLSVLQELGYSLSDFDLWEGWLILEEASAEQIIRQFLIPMFAPGLTQVRTLSTKGNNQLEATFADFNRLVKFTHLESVYHGKAWVRTDGDSAGEGIVARLKNDYQSWNPDHFKCFSKSQFEKYYPEEFSDMADAALSLANRDERYAAKNRLRVEVVNWLKADAERARVALSQSAAEIIDDLKGIEKELKG